MNGGGRKFWKHSQTKDISSWDSNIIRKVIDFVNKKQVGLLLGGGALKSWQCSGSTTEDDSMQKKMATGEYGAERKFWWLMGNNINLHIRSNNTINTNWGIAETKPYCVHCGEKLCLVWRKYAKVKYELHSKLPLFGTDKRAKMRTNEDILKPIDRLKGSTVVFGLNSSPKFVSIR